MPRRGLKIGRMHWLSAAVRSLYNCKKVGSLEAGAADQGATDLRQRQYLRRVRRFHRSAVEDAQARPIRQAGANVCMHRRDLGIGGRLAGADRPNRLISDGRVCGARARRDDPANCVLQTCSALPASRSASVSPMQMIASRPARHAALALAATTASRLAMILATLGMSDDDGRRSGVPQHLRADVAGERTRSLSVAVLAAELDA